MTFLYCSPVYAQQRHRQRPLGLQEVLQANEEKNNFDWQYISITSHKREKEKTLTQDQKVKHEEMLNTCSRADCRVTVNGCNYKALCVCEKLDYDSAADKWQIFIFTKA